MRAELSWPTRSLSPNGRIHYMAHARAKKDAKIAAHWICLAAGFGGKEWHHKPKVSVTLCPPEGKVRADFDNAVASCKALVDGVASAMGVDDGQFDIAFAWGDPVKRGAVVVEVG